MLSGMVRPDTGEGSFVDVERRSDDRLKHTGLIASIIWVVGAGVYVVVMWSAIFELKPNEFGDFLAGVFAPLAFFWLVLGFYQQGEELRASVDALTLQSEEMRHSVEQQKLLAEATREQVEREKAAAEAARYESLRADMRIYFEKVVGRDTHKLIVRNAGPYRAESVRLEITKSQNLLVQDELALSFPSDIPSGHYKSISLNDYFYGVPELVGVLHWKDGHDYQELAFREYAS